VSNLNDAVAGATAGVQRNYELGKVPAKPDYPYSTYAATLGPADGYTLDSVGGLRQGEVLVQSFARTEGAASEQLEQVAACLLDQILSAAGWTTTPLRYALRPVVLRQSEPENAGVISITATFTFTASR
jgi:hypothetical protein